MRVHLTKEEAALLIQAGLESNDSPLILKGDIEECKINVTQNGVTLTIEYKNPDDDPENE